MADATDDVSGENVEGKSLDEVELRAASTESKKGPEPSRIKKLRLNLRSFELQNPSRITPEQENFVSFNLEQRYVPVNPRSKPAGIVVLVDRTPDEPEDVVQVRTLH